MPSTGVPTSVRTIRIAAFRRPGRGGVLILYNGRCVMIDSLMHSYTQECFRRCCVRLADYFMVFHVVSPVVFDEEQTRSAVYWIWVEWSVSSFMHGVVRALSRRELAIMCLDLQ